MDLEDGQMMVAARTFVAHVLVGTAVVAEAVMVVFVVAVVEEQVVAVEYFEAALQMDLVLEHRENCRMLVLKELTEAGLEG